MADEEQKLTKKEKRALKKQQKEAAKQKEASQARMKKFGIIGLVILVLGIGAYYLFNSVVTVPEEEKDKPVDQVLADDWVKGNPDAEIVVVEYSDFQCPACQLYAPIVTQLVDENPDKVVVVYRHFPLGQIHLQANLAAQAAEAAGYQGYFWEMHDLLFENQEEWSENRNAKNIFIGYAESIDGLDIERFKDDLVAKSTKAAVKADYLSAMGYGLSSTPSFYINGELVENPQGIEGFYAVLGEILPATDSAELQEVTDEEEVAPNGEEEEVEEPKL